jgi:hypothetical protein
VKLYVEPGADVDADGDVVEVWDVLTWEGREVASFDTKPEALAVRDTLERFEVRV